MGLLSRLKKKKPENKPSTGGGTSPNHEDEPVKRTESPPPVYRTAPDTESQEDGGDDQDSFDEMDEGDLADDEREEDDSENPPSQSNKSEEAPKPKREFSWEDYDYSGLPLHLQRENEERSRPPITQEQLEKMPLEDVYDMARRLKRTDKDYQPVTDFLTALHEKQSQELNAPTSSEREMKTKNSQTREKLGDTQSDDKLKGLKSLRDAFEGFKSGDEADFLREGDQKTELGARDYYNLHGAQNTAKTTFKSLNDGLSEFASNHDIPLIGAVKSVIRNIKGFIELLKNRKDDEKTKESKQEKSFIDSKRILQFFDNKKETIMSLASHIPYLGTIVEAVKIVKDIFKVVKAQSRRKNMNNAKRLFKEKYLGKNFYDADALDRLSVIKYVSYANPKRWFKSTSYSVNHNNLIKRRDKLLQERDQPNLTKEFKEAYNEELHDIMQYEIQESMSKKNKKIQFKGIAGIIAKVGKIIGQVSSAGSSSVLEFFESGSKAVGKALKIQNAMDSVTKVYNKKVQKGSRFTNYLFEIIGALPKSFEGFEEKIAYAQVKQTMDASGNAKKVYPMGEKINSATSDEEKNRMKSGTYKLFMKMFEG
jgi:hypothetical protein